jgi:flagellar hook-associated protein 3 FlgL
MDLRSTITQIKQFLDNSTVVKNQLTVTNSALDTVVSSIERVRDIAMTAANASTTEESRTGLVAELDQIMGTLMTAGNTKNGEKYVFAGSKTTTQPIIESTAEIFRPVNMYGREFGMRTCRNVAVSPPP